MVELSSNQLAYLLATVGAKSIIGLDEPDLFPQGPQAEEKVFGGGRKELEADGWIREVADHPGEYQLDPFLLEMSAIVGAPEYVVAVANDSDGDRKMRMIYMVDQLAVELAPLPNGKYALGYVPDDSSVGEHISELFELDGAGVAGEFSVSTKALEHLKKKASAGQLDQAAEILEGDEEDRIAVTQAAAGPLNGRIVVIRASAGEIASGRRAVLFGTAGNVWLEYMPGPEESDLTLVQASSDRVDELLDRWLKQLETQSEEVR